MRQTQLILYQCAKVACAKMARGILACGISPPHRRHTDKQTDRQKERTDTLMCIQTEKLLDE